MIRLPIPFKRIASLVEPTSSERHYLTTVLRLRAGDTLEVFDGAGGRYLATVQDDGRLSLGERREEARPRARVGLAQALAKGEKMELVVQKATELGANVIVPFRCERAVVRLDEKKAVERVERWRRIAAEAARQCGRADVPEVPALASFEEVVRWSGARPVLLYEKEQHRTLSQAILATEEPLLLITGPEGGFSEREVEVARAAGVEVVTLGSLILRTETVALAALSVAQYLRGGLG